MEPAGGAETSLAVQANTTNNLKVGNLFWSTDYTSKTNSTTQITYTFSRPINNFSLTLLDVDRNTSNFIDAVTLDAYQADGNILKMSSSSDATVTNNTAYTSVSGNTITGIQQNIDGEANGTVTVTFSKPITSFVITYRNTYNIADPGVQYIGITQMTWCTQANVATTLSGPTHESTGSSVSYVIKTTANGDYAAAGVKPVIQLTPGLNVTNAGGGSYNATTGLLTLPTIATLNTGVTSTSTIQFVMPSSAVTGKASSTIDTDDSDPKDNNGSLAAANVMTTINQSPTAQARDVSVSPNRDIFTPLPAMTGTDPDNDPLTYSIIGTSLFGAGYGTIYYTDNGTRVALKNNTDITLTAAQAATLEFQRGANDPANLSRNVQYFATDSYGASSPTVTYRLTIGDRPAVYSSPNVYQRSTYTNGQALATVSDPDGTINSASITSGTLPANMSFNLTTGIFSGNVTTILGVRSGEIAAGVYNFTVTTTGTGGAASTGTTTNIPVTITILGADRAATYSTSNRFNRDALANGASLATVTDPDAAIQSAALASGSTLPSGMTIDNTSGQITVGSAMPFAGSYTYNVNTTDAAGGTSSPAVTITVFDDTEAIYALAAAPAGVYNNNDVLATVSDADGAVNSASALSGASSLPAGVSLNPTTGQFIVTDRSLLRQGTYPVQVRTTDATGGITTQTVNLVIKSRPLPVTLVSFVAKAAGTDAQLSWTTAQELNNDHFAVERSFDGSRFVAVAEVKGKGTTSAATSYSLTDAQVASKGRAAYYRLRQVDTDGTSTYSTVEMVRFAGAAAQATLDVYPNPATSFSATRLNLAGMSAGTYQVSIVDLTGRVQRRFAQAGGSNELLDITELPAGTYLVQVQGNGQAFTKRLVKQ